MTFHCKQPFGDDIICQAMLKVTFTDHQICTCVCCDLVVRVFKVLTTGFVVYN